MIRGGEVGVFRSDCISDREHNNIVPKYNCNNRRNASVTDHTVLLQLDPCRKSKRRRMRYYQKDKLLIINKYNHPFLSTTIISNQ